MYLSQHDLLTGAFTLGIIVITLGALRVAQKKGFITNLIGRKLLHITAICGCSYAINSFENTKLLAYIFLGFFFILLGVIKKGWMQVNTFKTYGISLFPLAFAILLFIPILPKNIIVFATLCLGICDALAGITGVYFSKRQIIFLYEQKSWVGFIAFFLSCFVLSIIYFNQFSLIGLMFCSLIAIIPALTELFSYKGSDNLSVPIITAIWTFFILQLNIQEAIHLLIALVIFLPLCVASVYKKWLTVSGATAAMWMALLLFVSGGVQAFIAPGIFLLSGSLASKLNNNDKEKNGRNSLQVFCNGIVGIVCLVLYNITHQQYYLLATLVSFCISMSDSISSELGTYFKGKTIDILSLKKSAIGISGGISWQGTLAGLCGAVLLGSAVYAIFKFTAIIFYWIVISGFIGMLVDSIFGSLFQAKYSSSSGILIEDEEAGAIKTRGFSWCNNNMVNLLSNIIVTLLFILLYR